MALPKRLNSYHMPHNTRPLDPLPYPWLPPTDEANMHEGIYVPTPEELESQVAVLREQQIRHPRTANDHVNGLCRVVRRKRAFE